MSHDAETQSSHVPDVRVDYPAKLVPRFMKYRKPVETHHDIEYLLTIFSANHYHY